MPNSVQTLPAIEAGLLSYHLSFPQETLPRREAKARTLRVPYLFGMPLVDLKSFFHPFTVLDEAAAMCFFAEDTEENKRDNKPSIKSLDTLVTREER